MTRSIGQKALSVFIGESYQGDFVRALIFCAAYMAAIWISVMLPNPAQGGGLALLFGGAVSIILAVGYFILLVLARAVRAKVILSNILKAAALGWMFVFPWFYLLYLVNA